MEFILVMNEKLHECEIKDKAFHIFGAQICTTTGVVMNLYGPYCHLRDEMLFAGNGMESSVL